MTIDARHPLPGSRPLVVGAGRSGGIVTLCVMLCGVGVFLGRFERLNSWELITDPRAVAASASSALWHPSALVFSSAFALFVGAGYLFTRPRLSAS